MSHIWYVSRPAWVDVCMWWIADGSCFIRGISSSSSSSGGGRRRRQHLLESSLDNGASSDTRVPTRLYAAAAAWQQQNEYVLMTSCLISALYARCCYLLCTTTSSTMMQFWSVRRIQYRNCWWWSLRCHVLSVKQQFGVFPSVSLSVPSFFLTFLRLRLFSCVPMRSAYVSSLLSEGQ